MIDAIMQNKKMFIYCAVVVAVIAVVNFAVQFETAKDFDKYNRIMLMSGVFLYSIVFQSTSIKELTGKLFFIGVVAYIASLVAYNLYDEVNKYFSFEMGGFTWNGISGFVGFLIYWIQAYFCSLVAFMIKVKLVMNK